MKKIAVLLLTVLLFSTGAQAQSPFLDSLKTELYKAKHDTARCFILSVLIENEYDEKIWPLYNDSMLLLAKKNMERLPAGSLKTLYTTYYANAINNKGFLAQEQGNISKALEHYSASLKITESIGEKKVSATTINNIAYIYMQQGDITKALDWVQKALRLQKITGDKKGASQSLNNLGNLYHRKNESQKALAYFEESLKMQIELGDKYGESMCLGNIGDVYIKSGNRKKGAEYILKSLEIRKKLDDPEGIAYSLERVADLMFQEGNYTEALKYGKESFEVAKRSNYAESVRNASRTLYKVYKKLNKDKEALDMHELYFRMYDSLNNEATRKASIKNQLEYEYEKKAAADSVKLADEKKITQMQLTQEKTQRYALYGGLALVIIFSVFMVNRFLITNKQKKIIELKERETQQQNTIITEQKHLVEEKQKEILDSINYAKRIQYTLLAHADFLQAHIPDHFVYFNPKDIVSGDFYWATQQDKYFYLAVCDSTGHGVPGAFMSLLNIGFLSEAINEKNITDPAEVFNYVRTRLTDSISKEGQKDGFDGVLLRLEISHQHIISAVYAAANNAPVLVSNNTCTELPKDRMPVGKGEKNESFVQYQVPLQKGDVLYLYTDGFADQFGGPKGKKFKYKALNDLLLSIHQQPPDAQKTQLSNAFNDWRANLEQVDDVLVAGIFIS